MKHFRLALIAVSVWLSACTYAPPETIVRVANHVYRQGTDSIGIAVYAAKEEKPTGLAAFPDGGRARVERESAIFYLCVMSPGVSPPFLRRIAVIPRPDSLRSGFTPWLTSWGGPDKMIASLRGYVGEETRTEDHRMVWIAIDLDGRVTPIGNPAAAGAVATSLPPLCETAVLADAKTIFGSL